MYCQEHISLVNAFTNVASGIKLDLTVCESTGKLPNVMHPKTQTSALYS